MPSYSVIHDVSIELRRQLFASLKDAADVDFGLADAASNIVLTAPDEDTGPTALASLYLYHLIVDRNLRNQRPIPDPVAADEFRRPPLPIQLRYLLTPLAEDPLTSHVLLGRVLQHVHDHPVFDLAGGNADTRLRISLDPMSVEQLTQLWGALSVPFRLSAALLVDIVPIDSALPPERVTRVSETLALAGLKAR